MTTWLTPALAAAAMFGANAFFIKLAGDKIAAPFGVAIMSSVAVAVALLTAVGMKMAGAALPFSKDGLMFSILAGVTVGAAEMLYFFTFDRGAPLNLGSPIVTVGIALSAVVLGLLFLGESLTLTKFIGIVLAAVAIFLLAQK